MKYERLLGGEAPQPHHRHESRLLRLSDAGVPWDEIKDIHQRVQAEYYRPRSAEQIADDEVEITALEAANAERFADKRRKDRALRLDHLDIPVNAADLQLLASDDIQQTRAVKATRLWLATEQPVLVLSGPCGRGKTVACADALLRQHGRYARASDVARLFLASFGDDVELREKLIHEPQLLVLDDIGTELRADLMSVALIEAVDARRRGQRTILITNLSRAAFEQRYADERLHSRLAQAATWIIDPGADLRRQRQ